MSANSIDGEIIKIRRARIDSVNVYEVNEHELISLENGSEASLELNFSIALISIGIGAIFTINTATFSIKAVETVAWIFATVGNLFALYLFLKWLKSRKKVKELARTIRSRMPVDRPTDQQNGAPQHIELPDDPVPEGDEDASSAQT